MKCPICKKEIKDGATKCEHCGSYIRWLRRKWQGVREVVQFATFVAAIVVGYLIYQGNERMQEQLNLQRESVEYVRQQFIEEKRPRIEIHPDTLDLTDTSSVLYVNFKNMGFADAEDLSIYYALKYEQTPRDTLADTLVHVPRITTARGLTLMWSLPALKKVNLTCLIDVRYTWTIRDLNYKMKRHYRFYYDKQRERYGIHVLVGEQIKQLWE